MEGEVEEHNVGIPYTRGQPKRRRKLESDFQQIIINSAVPLPKQPIHVVFLLVGFRAVKMGKIESKKVGDKHNSSKRRKLGCLLGSHGFP